MFLFIFESIGTSELLLIGTVALIVFGPRKLPQMAKTLGKAMSEFRNTTNEFKSTWEREANFEDLNPLTETNTIKTTAALRDTKQATIISPESPKLPEIKEIDAGQFNLPTQEIQVEKIAVTANEKQSWL